MHFLSDDFVMNGLIISVMLLVLAVLGYLIDGHEEKRAKGRVTR